MQGPGDEPTVAEGDDHVAAAVEAAPHDDRPESPDELAAVAEARAEPDGFVHANEVARALEAWLRPATE